MYYLKKPRITMKIKITMLILQKPLCSVLFVAIIFTRTQGLLEKFKDLKEKANKIKDNVKVVTESKRGAPIKFMPKSDILYPGLDKTKVEKVKQLWNEYYDCQKALYETTIKMVVPLAIGFLQGSNALLDCEVCESPNDMFLDTTWFYAKDYNMNHVEEIILSETILLKNDSLQIFNIGESNGGLYVCKKGNHSARPYVVHVFSDEPTKMVVPEANAEGPHPAPDQPMPALPVTLTTTWGQWTQCSRCDNIGKRHRTGICTVVAHQSETRKKRTELTPRISQNVVSNIEPNQKYSENSTLQINKNMSRTDFNGTEINGDTTENSSYAAVISNTTISSADLDFTKNRVENMPNKVKFNADLELLNLFEEGIPCRSKMLSESFRNLEIVASRSSEVLEAYCKLSCPKSILFVVVDEEGNILETANNSDGVYSVLQGLPRDIPGVTRSLEFATHKKPFKMECPGNRNGDIPVEWYVGHKAITNKIMKKETKGRIKIDEYGRIVFNPALIVDSRVFSCWQRDELVGTVRLLVKKTHNLQYQRPVMIVGTLIIFATFFWVYYSAFTNSSIH